MNVGLQPIHHVRNNNSVCVSLCLVLYVYYLLFTIGLNIFEHTSSAEMTLIEAFGINVFCTV